MLFDETSKGWYLSGPALYKMIEDEKRMKKAKLPEQSKMMFFLVFCLESYKASQNKTAEEAVAIFSAYNVFDFLKENFEVLHTQG
jgi:hypothetical protein